MPSLPRLSSLQCHFVYVVCMPLSLRLTLYKFDAYGHHPKQPPGMTVQPASLSSLRP
jgi:hypothetical protein